MPTKEVDEAIAVLEAKLRHYETLLDQSINDNEILAKTKVILQELKQVAKELSDLKKLEAKKN